MALIPAFYPIFNRRTATSQPNIEERVKKLEEQLAQQTGNQPTHQAPPKPTPETRDILAQLIESHDATKQKAVELLEADEVQAGIQVLKDLYQQQRTAREKQSKAELDTALQLAALLNYTDPQQALDILANTVELVPNSMRALNQYALLLLRLGKVLAAEAQWQKILQLAQENKDRQAEGVALGNLGIAYRNLGEYRKAIDYYEQALVISREIGGRQNEGNHLGNLGVAYYSLDQTPKAIKFYEQALAISREIGDREGEGNRLGNLGIAYDKLGQTNKARDYWQQALVIYEEIQSPHAEQVRAWLAE